MVWHVFQPKGSKLWKKLLGSRSRTSSRSATTLSSRATSFVRDKTQFRLQVRVVSYSMWFLRASPRCGSLTQPLWYKVLLGRMNYPFSNSSQTLWPAKKPACRCKLTRKPALWIHWRNSFRSVIRAILTGSFKDLSLNSWCHCCIWRHPLRSQLGWRQVTYFSRCTARVISSSTRPSRNSSWCRQTLVR